MAIRNRTRCTVKDEFKIVLTDSDEELTLCIDCVENLNDADILFTQEPAQHDDLMCDNCKALNGMAAYVDEIEVSHLFTE